MADTSEALPLLYMKRGKPATCGAEFWKCVVAYIIILIIAVTAAVFLTIYVRGSGGCSACWQIGTMKGIVILQPDDSKIRGTLLLSQGNSTKPVEISGMISGLKPNSVYQITVQPNGNLADGCSSSMLPSKDNSTSNTVELQNPDPFKTISSFGTHWPDFTSDDDGSISIYIMDTILSLCGQNSIVGRTILISEIEDETSIPIGCGLVGYIAV